MTTLENQVVVKISFRHANAKVERLSRHLRGGPGTPDDATASPAQNYKKPWVRGEIICLVCNVLTHSNRRITCHRSAYIIRNTVMLIQNYVFGETKSTEMKKKKKQMTCNYCLFFEVMLLICCCKCMAGNNCKKYCVVLPFHTSLLPL